MVWPQDLPASTPGSVSGQKEGSEHCLECSLSADIAWRGTAAWRKQQNPPKQIVLCSPQNPLQGYLEERPVWKTCYWRPPNPDAPELRVPYPPPPQSPHSLPVTPVISFLGCWKSQRQVQPSLLQGSKPRLMEAVVAPGSGSQDRCGHCSVTPGPPATRHPVT